MIKEAPGKIKKLFPGFPLLSLKIFILLAVFTAALLSFVLIAETISKNAKINFDLKAFGFLSRFENNVNTNVMVFFTFLGTHTFLIPANILLITGFLLLKKRTWYSINISVISLSSLLLMFCLKFIFHRDRPLTPLLQEAHGYSFPSGHALMSFTFYGTLIYLAWLRVKKLWLKWTLIIVLALLILAIGLSRIYLRVHYASDVIAGYCVGCMWLLLSLFILNKIEKNRSKKKQLAEQRYTF